MRLFQNKVIVISLALSPFLGLLYSLPIQAAKISSDVYSSNQTYLGNITFEDSKYGLLIRPHVKGIPEGIHGFHIHEHPDCSNHGMNAGGHFDPNQTHSHQGPYGEGHRGDLPALVIDKQGNAVTPMLAPRLQTKDLPTHTIMIHAGGDNYSDNPPLGGGGERIGCGKITHFNDKALR